MPGPRADPTVPVSPRALLRRTGAASGGEHPRHGEYAIRHDGPQSTKRFARAAGRRADRGGGKGGIR